MPGLICHFKTWKQNHLSCIFIDIKNEAFHTGKDIFRSVCVFDHPILQELLQEGLCRWPDRQ